MADILTWWIPKESLQTSLRKKIIQANKKRFNMAEDIKGHNKRWTEPDWLQVWTLYVDTLLSLLIFYT